MVFMVCGVFMQRMDVQVMSRCNEPCIPGNLPPISFGIDEETKSSSIYKVQLFSVEEAL